MAMEDRIEGLYLNVWRGIVFFVATVSLLVAVVASLIAVGGLVGSTPTRPDTNKLEDRSDEIRKALSIERFRNAEADVTTRSAVKWKDASREIDEEQANEEALRKIVDNLDSYNRAAFPERHPNREIIRLTVRNLVSDPKLAPQSHRALYLSSLESLTADLAKTGAAQAQVPEDRRMDADRLVRWHADILRRALRTVEQDNATLEHRYQRQLTDYANRHTRVLSYAGVAAGAFTIFVLTVFLYLVIKIERDLKMMAVASMVTTRQLATPSEEGSK
jgi:hypothetical protein